MDGIRLEMSDGSWLLVRPSRTEPFVRVTAECSSAAGRDALLDAGAALAHGDM